MKATKLGERFFESTRGRLVSLLRGRSCTVNELAEKLEMTDNAVRAHLTTLERDGLIRQSGVQRGHRKPHFAYELTPEAEQLFPKSYDALLNVLLSVLKERLSAEELGAVLREVGRKAAAEVKLLVAPGSDLSTRARQAVEVLQALGGAPQLEEPGGQILIRSASCPLGTAVEAHPEVCRVAETLVAQITGGRVREKCEKTPAPPRCRFEITEKSRRSG
ncbi:MAG TPA: ArsR family transcriptional regulator [Blastocatellia bacterium]|nr:ArsR family transcriptional regulator [Blastocatellia bacterium]